MAWTIINNSKTSITEYLTGSYATSLSTLENALLTSITSNIVVTIGPFPPGGINLSSSSTSGLGINAMFNLVVLEIGPITGITVTTAGSGYAVGDTLTFTAADMMAAAPPAFGGTVGNLVITLAADDFGTDGSGGIIVPDTTSLNSVEQNIAGYPMGVISFVVSPAPDSGGGSAWAAGSTLEISIIGGIEISNFTMNTLVIAVGDTESTLYVDWNIPLQTVALEINNNTARSTGQEITISSIRMQTSSKGGGRGFVTSSGASIGPGGDPPQIQFNDMVGGSPGFGGTFGALYNKTANISTGQIQLANGTFSLPILAFPPDYDTGIYLYTSGVLPRGVAISGDGDLIVAVLGSNSGNFIKGFNVGQTSNICKIQRLSLIPANSWEDGHMGNSANLVFTGSDFTNNRDRNGGPIQFGVAPYTGAANGANGFIMAVPAWAFNNEIIAVKLLPKGFQVANSAVSVYSSGTSLTIWDATGGARAPTIELFTQDILTPMVAPISLTAAISMTTWGGTGVNTQYTPSLSVVGTGTLALVVRIMIQSAQQITLNDALVGVKVPIERR